ncbi:unnamed protein product [Boreogadus saida]
MVVVVVVVVVVVGLGVEDGRMPPGLGGVGCAHNTGVYEEASQVYPNTLAAAGGQGAADANKLSHGGVVGAPVGCAFPLAALLFPLL